MRILLVAHNTVKVGFATFIDVSTAFASETKCPFLLLSTLFKLLLGRLLLLGVSVSPLLAGFSERQEVLACETI